MDNFEIGEIGQWRLLPGAGVEFFGPEDGVRAIEWELLAPSPVRVYACPVGVSDAVPQLVGFGKGHLAGRFTCPGDVCLFVGDDAGQEVAEVWMRSRRASPLVVNDEPTFTEIGPRPARLQDDVRRMMMAMEYHARRREDALREEVEALRRVQQAPALQPEGGGDVAQP